MLLFCVFFLSVFPRLFQLLDNTKGDHIDSDNSRLTGNHGRTSRLEDERESMPRVTSMAWSLTLRSILLDQVIPDEKEPLSKNKSKDLSTKYAIPVRYFLILLNLTAFQNTRVYISWFSVHDSRLLKTPDVWPRLSSKCRRTSKQEKKISATWSLGFFVCTWSWRCQGLH